MESGKGTCKDKSAQYEVCNKDDHCLDRSSRCLNDDGSDVAVDGTDTGKCYRVNHYDVGTLLETGGIEQECKSGKKFLNTKNSETYCTYAEYDTTCTDDDDCGDNMSCVSDKCKVKNDSVCRGDEQCVSGKCSHDGICVTSS